MKLRLTFVLAAALAAGSGANLAAQPDEQRARHRVVAGWLVEAALLIGAAIGLALSIVQIAEMLG